jgi:hypothetical protein
MHHGMSLLVPSWGGSMSKKIQKRMTKMRAARESAEFPNMAKKF